MAVSQLTLTRFISVYGVFQILSLALGSVVAAPKKSPFCPDHNLHHYYSGLEGSQSETLKSWESQNLGQFHVLFQRAWRNTDAQHRYFWVMEEKKIDQSVLDGIRKSLGTIRTEHALTDLILNLKDKPLTGSVSVNSFESLVHGSRSKLYTWLKFSEIDYNFLPTELADLQKKSKNHLDFYQRPKIDKPLSDLIALEGDEPLQDLTPIIFDIEKGEQHPLYKNGIVPWGYPKIAQPNHLEADFYRIREIEEQVLQIQKSEGQIGNIIPELLAGDRLDPEQAFLFVSRSRVPIDHDKWTKVTQQWIASGRNPLPIQFFIAASGTSVSQQLKAGIVKGIKGEMEFTNGVLRTVNNYKIENGKFFYLPLQWERSNLSKSTVEKIFRKKVSLNRGVNIRIELGRAYAREPIYMIQLLMGALTKVQMDLKLLNEAGYTARSIVFEVHAGTLKNANYYMGTYGFKPKPGVSLGPNHWVLEAEVHDFIQNLTDRLNKFTKK